MLKINKEHGKYAKKSTKRLLNKQYVKKVYTVLAGFEAMISWFTAQNFNHWATFP